ncbi:hypothetical protein V8C86DRAFT_2451630 [Haematococcus lacustris]
MAAEWSDSDLHIALDRALRKASDSRLQVVAEMAVDHHQKYKHVHAALERALRKVAPGDAATYRNILFVASRILTLSYKQLQEKERYRERLRPFVQKVLGLLATSEYQVHCARVVAIWAKAGIYKDEALAELRKAQAGEGAPGPQAPPAAAHPPTAAPQPLLEGDTQPDTGSPGAFDMELENSPLGQGMQTSQLPDPQSQPWQTAAPPPPTSLWHASSHEAPLQPSNQECGALPDPALRPLASPPPLPSDPAPPLPSNPLLSSGGAAAVQPQHMDQAPAFQAGFVAPWPPWFPWPPAGPGGQPLPLPPPPPPLYPTPLPMQFAGPAPDFAAGNGHPPSEWGHPPPQQQGVGSGFPPAPPPATKALHMPLPPPPPPPPPQQLQQLLPASHAAAYANGTQGSGNEAFMSVAAATSAATPPPPAAAVAAEQSVNDLLPGAEVSSSLYPLQESCLYGASLSRPGPAVPRRASRWEQREQGKGAGEEEQGLAGCGAEGAQGTAQHSVPAPVTDQAGHEYINSYQGLLPPPPPPPAHDADMGCTAQHGAEGLHSLPADSDEYDPLACLDD